MTKNPEYNEAAINLADAILRAAGSGLQNYSLPGIRKAILDAAQKGIDEAGGEDNAHSGERHWVRSSAMDADEFTDGTAQRSIQQFADMLARDAKGNGKRVRFYVFSEIVDIAPVATSEGK